MKNIKLHLIVLALVIITEMIGTISIPVGPGRIVLVPMLYALIIGIVLTIIGRKIPVVANKKDMADATSLISLTLLLLMARYGTTVGPNLPQIIRSSPALILQEFGNLGTLLIGIPVAVLLGLKREAIGAAHSVAREPNVALIGERFGLDSAEGRGVMGVYICGTVFGTIFIALLSTFCGAFLPFHPYSLAMAAGVGSASMMTASVATLTQMFPDMSEMITSFGAASNMLSGLDGLYMSLFIALPAAEWLYRKCYKLKYHELPAPSVRIDKDSGEVVRVLKDEVKAEGKINLINSLIVLLVVAVMSLVGNHVGYKNSIAASAPGMLILVAMAFAGLAINKLFPKIPVPAAAWIVTITCVFTIPGVPGAEIINPLMAKVNFMSLTTPILAYAGISIGKDLEVFKKSGWRIIILACVVFTGTFIGSAIIAQVILKLLGQI